MQIFVSNPDAYVSSLNPERQQVMEKLRTVIKSHIPAGFEECMSYGMIGYVVPHSLYPAGYHCNSSLPLPFMAIASQKNSIHLYHMGIYANTELKNWWENEYQKLDIGKLDMGKSCIRWKKIKTIPYDLIGELAKKITVPEWVEFYTSHLQK